MEDQQITQPFAVRVPHRTLAYVEHTTGGGDIIGRESSVARVEIVRCWSASGMRGPRLMLWLDDFCVEVAVEPDDAVCGKCGSDENLMGDIGFTETGCVCLDCVLAAA